MKKETQPVARPRVALVTLGCKANQYESGQFAAEFAARGCDVVDDVTDADVLVVNTCTVTNVADSKSRRQLRRLRRLNPNALLVATGCAAELDAPGLEEATRADLVFSNKIKATLVGSVISLRGLRDARFQVMTEDVIPQNVEQCRLTSLGRTRALLMIQNGCGYKCSYCIIPTARPLRESRPFEELLDESRSLVQQGYREIVITGISIGSWRDGSHRLHHLLKAMGEIDGLRRIRLSSIEPKTVTIPLLETMAESNACCPHLHIPLQAGDDTTLRDMNRYYDTATFARLIRKVRKILPGAAISTDVITGFPTETTEQFERTFRFCEEMDFCKIHVFPFSARAGTPAAAMKDTVGGAERKERTARLISLSDEGSQRWAESHIGSNVKVLAETRERHTGLFSGLTPDNVRVEWAQEAECQGETVPVRVISAAAGVAHGVPA